MENKEVLRTILASAGLFFLALGISLTVVIPVFANQRDCQVTLCGSDCEGVCGPDGKGGQCGCYLEDDPNSPDPFNPIQYCLCD
jgi:hypothetical protein